MRRIALLALCVLAPAAPAGQVASLEDIEFWVGEGAQRAGLAIDWYGASSADASLVWGYRWDGEATGERMLLDVIAADPRLFAKVNYHGAFSFRPIGVGYDLNDDGAFALDDATAFGVSGVAVTAASDGVASVDAGDLYAEGWSRAYWHYGVGSPDGWSSSGSGAAARPLSDGDWDSWALARTLNYDEFAAGLVAAEPPPLAGDFNADGAVDAADYTVWRDAGGTPQAYSEWSVHYGASYSTPRSLPEPTGAALVALVLTLRTTPWRRR